MTNEINVLIIDDNEEFCQTLIDVLIETGLNAKGARNGSEAIDRFEKQPFDVVLIDIKLPDIDGIELLKTIKRIAPDTEAIMVTGYASIESAVAAVRFGAMNYIIKPPVIKDVIHSIWDAVNKRRISLEERQRLSREIGEKERYHTLSIMDSLTGLYNRRYFHEFLDGAIKRAERYSHPLSLLMIDIDHFKKYQDAHGHIAGDRAIEHIASVLRNTVREVDVVARYGGEEFVVVAPEEAKSDAAIVANRIREAVAGTKGPLIDTLTISIGVADYPEDAEDKEQLIAHADYALYHAKQNGRNRVVLWMPDLRNEL